MTEAVLLFVAFFLPPLRILVEPVVGVHLLNPLLHRQGRAVRFLDVLLYGLLAAHCGGGV